MTAVGRRLRRTRLRRIVVGELAAARWRVLLAVFALVSYTVTMLLTPWPLKLVFDQVLLDKPLPSSMSFLNDVLAHGDTVALAVIAAAMILIALLRGFFSYAQIYISSRLGYDIMHALRRELFGHVQRLSLSFHSRSRAGELLTRITSDTSALRDAFAGWALLSVGDVMTLTGMFVVMAALNWHLALLPLASFPLLYLSLRILYRRTKSSARLQRKGEGRIASRISEVLTSVALVQAYGREGYEQERLESESRQNMEENVRTARLEAASTRTTEVLTAVVTAAVVLFGAMQVQAGTLTPGELLVFTGYLSSMYKPIRNLAKTSTRLSKASVSMERMNELLELEPDVRDTPGAVPAPALRGAIAFDGVSFRYGDGAPVLDGVSFQVQPGARVALVGPSGAGKSTIASLLLRFYDPADGSVTVDGLDLRDLRLDSLRSQIAVVPQESVLFGTSIRENIAYGRPDASDEEIERAARAAHAHEFIERFPEGYDTEVGERGSTLSGGQRRRIAIARALVRDAPILILDEPMTGLDAASEALVHDALERLMAGRTCLTITHDARAASDADVVLLLEHGRVVERANGRAPGARKAVEAFSSASRPATARRRGGLLGALTDGLHAR